MSGAFVSASVAIGLISLTSGIAIKIRTEIFYNLSRMGFFGERKKIGSSFFPMLSFSVREFMCHARLISATRLDWAMGFG